MSIKDELYSMIEEKVNYNITEQQQCVQIYINALESFIDRMDDDEIIEESGNATSLVKYTSLNTTVKGYMTKYRKHIKAAEFSEARKCIKQTHDAIAEAEKEIREADDGTISLIVSNAIPTFSSVTEAVLVCSLNIVGVVTTAATLIAAIAGSISIALAAPLLIAGSAAIASAAVRTWARKTYDNMSQTIQLINNIRVKFNNNEDVTMSDFNKFKNDLLYKIAELKRSVNDEFKFIDIIESEYKSELKKRDTMKLDKHDKVERDSETKKLMESATNDIIKNINESFINGDITYEQKEYLLSELNN